MLDPHLSLPCILAVRMAPQIAEYLLTLFAVGKALDRRPLRREPPPEKGPLLERRALISHPDADGMGTVRLMEVTKLYFPNYGWQQTGRRNRRAPVGTIIKGLGLYCGTRETLVDGTVIIHVSCPAYRVLKDVRGRVELSPRIYGQARIECRVDQSLVEPSALQTAPDTFFTPFAVHT